MVEKLRVRIIASPSGRHIPLAMRQVLIGLEMEASGPIASLKEGGGLEEVYLFSKDLFLRTLKEKDHKTYEWFSVHITDSVIRIETAVCKKL